MTIIELKDQIIKNKLDNFYIFTGDEIGIINIYLQQMSNKLNMPITRADSVLSIYGKCTSRSMFGKQTGFYVIRDDNDFMKEESTYQKIQSDIGKNVIVLLYEKIDSRLKFGKYFKDKIVPFEKLAPSILCSYIKKKSNLNSENVATLGELCNGSYDIAMLECDKIKQYSDSKKCDVNTGFKDLLKSKTIYQPENYDVFKFTDAVCSKRKEDMFYIEEVLRNNDVSAVNVLGTLYNSLKSVMLIQCCKGNVCEVTGLDSRQVYFNKKYCGKYSTEKLLSTIKLICKTIEGIKSGYIDDCFSTRYVLVNLLS